ncbi:hypothetical protein RRG08_057973 [Elysia crispata]|uniref:Uncharacterized protein n=1 Tax=Elysia crispata TaxID=231223 RepID=A0AAE1AFK1_9GAST|nr:hypothetical protein RRG08_057973 [Elysia crispata]
MVVRSSSQRPACSAESVSLFQGLISRPSIVRSTCSSPAGLVRSSSKRPACSAQSVSLFQGLISRQLLGQPVAPQQAWSAPQANVPPVQLSLSACFKFQDEVQSAHWRHNQATLHPTVTYHRCPARTNAVTGTLSFLTADPQHGLHAAWQLTEMALQHLRAVRD